MRKWSLNVIFVRQGKGIKNWGGGNSNLTDNWEPCFEKSQHSMLELILNKE